MVVDTIIIIQKTNDNDRINRDPVMHQGGTLGTHLNCRKNTKFTKSCNFFFISKQGQIHGNPVADGWAGAVMRKLLSIQKCDLPTYGCTDVPTYRHGKV